HPQLEANEDAARSFDRLVDARDLARRDLEVLRHDLALGDDRMNHLVRDVVEIDAEAFADHHQRLAETHVLDLAGGDGGAELARGDDVTATAEELLELAGHVAEARAGRVADHFRFPLDLGRDLDADLAPEADHVAQVLADLVRIDVDGGDDPDPRLRQQQAGD